jgi:hypothetical protein
MRVPPSLIALIHMAKPNTHQVTDLKQTGPAALAQLWLSCQGTMYGDNDNPMAGTQTFTYKPYGV